MRRAIALFVVSVMIAVAMYATIATITRHSVELPGGWGDIRLGMRKEEIVKHLGAPGKISGIKNGAARDGSIYNLCNLPNEVVLPGEEVLLFRSFDETLLVFLDDSSRVVATFWCKAGRKTGKWIVGGGQRRTEADR